jgi:nucleotide-binding universal stress UspA family protein
MFKHILIPTDGSKLSDKAVKRALALAKANKARVTAVHVFSSTPAGGYGETAMGYELVCRRMRELGKLRAKKYLDRIETKAKASGVKFERAVMESDRAWEGIIGAARRKHCDLITIAAHGRGALSTLLLGSETNAVLAHSKIPVLVYR